MPMKKPIRPIKIPLRRMETLISPRPRKKIWSIFFAFFVVWYFLLYVFDWSSFPTLTPISQNQENSLKTLVVDPDHNDSFIDGNASSTVDVTDIRRNVSSDVTNIADEIENSDEKPSVNDVKRRNLRSCDGRYIYMHELPSKFNDDLVKDCKSLSKWSNMCQYLMNMGLGSDDANVRRLLTSNSWFTTHQFSLEVIFHERMKRYKCLTKNSSEAAAIYVPYYAGLDVARYLFDKHNISTRDAGSLDLVKWLRSKPEWERMGGRDHFMVAGRITWDFRRGVDEDSAWGNKLMLLPETQNMTMLTIESSPWNKNDFAIPYPTYFHPSRDDEVFSWQNKLRRRKRTALFTFVGGSRPNLKYDIRAEIMEQCRAWRRKCRLLECIDKTKKCNKPVFVMKMFQTSIFCLQPAGDSFTRRSTFDSILAGCIPVFFSPASAYVQYLWHLPKDHTKYSVLISEDDVKAKKVNIGNILSRIPSSKVLAMREEVIKLIPKVMYANPRSTLEKIEDAFDLTLKGVVERVENLRKEIREGKNFSSNFDEENSWKYYTFGKIEKHEWDHFLRRSNRYDLLT